MKEGRNNENQNQNKTKQTDKHRKKEIGAASGYVVCRGRPRGKSSALTD